MEYRMRRAEMLTCSPQMVLQMIVKVDIALICYINNLENCTQIRP